MPVWSPRSALTESKRQKDLADILRMIEAHPEVRDRLPPEIESQVE